MTTTHITNIAHMLDLTDYAGDFIDDYDMATVHADYVSMLNCDLPDGITLHANGDVIAELPLADQARDIDWADLTNERNVQPIFERHDLTDRIQLDYDADGFGKVVRKVHDTAGNLIVAWGPDTRDENGHGVDEISDEHWIGTHYDDDYPRTTFTGTRAEVFAWALNLIKGT
jgi:hypothetical protein